MRETRTQQNNKGEHMIDLDKINLDEIQGTSLGTPKFIKYTECEDGQVLVAGFYRGEYPNKFNKDKPNHKFEIKGRQIIVLPSSGQLDYLINNNVNVGDVVRVTYEGKEVLDSGIYKGKPVNRFNVELLIEAEPSAEIPEVKSEKSEVKVDTTDLDNLE